MKKINTFVASIGVHRRKMSKCVCGRGTAPPQNPLMELTMLPTWGASDPVDGFKGLTSKGRGRRGPEGKGGEGRGGQGRERKGAAGA